jgi:hypothetical protein
MAPQFGKANPTHEVLKEYYTRASLLLSLEEFEEFEK